MPKIDNTIKEAIIKASKQLGSQAQLAKAVGVFPASLSRYLNGQIKRINASTWNMLYPAIKDYLPEEYQRTFMNWKTKEGWMDFNQKYPESYNHITAEIENLDMEEIAKNSPLFGRSEEFLNTIKLITEKLPYLSQKTLNNFLITAITEIEDKKTKH